jgi:hypothetical protein
MSKTIAGAYAGGAGSVRGPSAFHAFRQWNGALPPKMGKGKGQKNGRKARRAEINKLAADKREVLAMLKESERRHQKSAADFGYSESWN